MDTFFLANLAGLAISVAPGPLGALCLSETLRGGLRAGLLMGLAVAAGDALLGGVAAVGADAIAGLPGWVRRTAAGVVAVALVRLGARMFRRRNEPPARRSAFLLALLTPGTVPALLVLFAALGVDRPVPAVAGVFVGGFAWWVVLCGLVHAFRETLVLRRFDYACGALLWVGAGAAAHFAVAP